jgi:cytoskeleton protein RodZ
MSSTPFGEQLKREREMRGVSLEEVAAATRIPSKFLEALESEKWNALPGGVFNRGFIRSVARFLGLDEDNMVAEYELMTRDQAEPPKPTELPLQFQRNWTALIVVIVTVLALLTGAIFLAVHFALRLRAHARAARTNAPIAAPAFAGSSAANAANASGSNSSPAHSTAQSPATAPASPPSPETSKGEPAEATSAAAAEPTGPMELRVDAGKATRVTVFADGKMIFERHLVAGDSKRFRAEQSFDVTSTDAGAVLLELNGRIVPPIGTPGQPGTIRLTHKDLSSSSEVPN